MEKPGWKLFPHSTRQFFFMFFFKSTSKRRWFSPPFVRCLRKRSKRSLTGSWLKFLFAVEANKVAPWWENHQQAKSKARERRKLQMERRVLCSNYCELDSQSTLDSRSLRSFHRWNTVESCCGASRRLAVLCLTFSQHSLCLFYRGGGKTKAVWEFFGFVCSNHFHVNGKAW
jgi:hypothetical protein